MVFEFSGKCRRREARMRKREKLGLCGGECDVMNVDDEIRTHTHRTAYQEHVVLAGDYCHSIGLLRALFMFTTHFARCARSPPHPPCVPATVVRGHQTHTKSTGKYYLLFLAAPPNTEIHKENDFLSAF